MKIATLIGMLLCSLCPLSSQAAEPQKSITLTSRLGHGFGKIFTARGKLLRPRTLGKGETAPKIPHPPMLSITAIEGKTLDNTIEIEFNGFMLDLDAKIKDVDPEREVEFALYEDIQTHGIPPGLAEYTNRVPASTEWRVATRAVVVKIK